MEPGKAVDTGRLQNIRVYWLAFVIYWSRSRSSANTSGYSTRAARRSRLKLTPSSNVVSFLQAGALCGPMSAQTYPRALHARLLPRPTLTTAASASVSASPTRGASSTASSAALPTFVSDGSPKESFHLAEFRSSTLSSSLSSIAEANDGISLNVKLAGSRAVRVWQIPFGFQLVMLLGQFTVKP
ncbi:hypothetical protein B0H13DRAFT_1912437 [Mycena leptocephala]|nr:hypothetical protein B0H13DRAFT_1912437 [Mycena leptocephala]